MASVTATIQYIQDDGDRAAYHASEAGGAAATHDGQFDPRQVQINDARDAAAGFDLDGVNLKSKASMERLLIVVGVDGRAAVTYTMYAFLCGIERS